MQPPYGRVIYSTRALCRYHGARPDLPKPFMNVSTRDLYDAYLPNYEALIRTVRPIMRHPFFLDLFAVLSHVSWVYGAVSLPSCAFPVQK